MLHRLAALGSGDGATPPSAGAGTTAGTSWRPVDDDLAVLVYDSRGDAELLAAVRSTGTALASSRSRPGQVLLELDVVDGAPLQMTCQIIPAQAARLTIRHRSGTVDAGEDRHGFFSRPRLPAGPVSLAMRAAGGGRRARCHQLARPLTPVSSGAPVDTAGDAFRSGAGPMPRPRS